MSAPELFELVRGLVTIRLERDESCVYLRLFSHSCLFANFPPIALSACKVEAGPVLNIGGAVFLLMHQELREAEAFLAAHPELARSVQ